MQLLDLASKREPSSSLVNKWRRLVFFLGHKQVFFWHQDSDNYDDQDDQPDEDNAEKGERRKSCGVWHKHSDWEHCHPAILGEEVRDYGGDGDDDWW